MCFGLRTMLIEQLVAGGQVLNVEKIENFPGFTSGISGFDLGPLVPASFSKALAEQGLPNMLKNFKARAEKLRRGA